MKKKNKFLSILLALCLVVTLIPATVSAERTERPNVDRDPELTGYLGEEYRYEFNIQNKETSLPFVSWRNSFGQLPPGLTLEEKTEWVNVRDSVTGLLHTCQSKIGVITGTPIRTGVFGFGIEGHYMNPVTGEKRGCFTMYIEMTINKAPMTSMTSGADKIDGYAKNGNEYDYLYFGKNEGASIKWRVLDDAVSNGGDDENKKTGLLLLSEYALKSTVFNQSKEEGNKWQNSDAQSWCEDFATKDPEDPEDPEVFTSTEKGAMLGVDKSDASYDHNYTTYPAVDGILDSENDKLFFLSAEEAMKADYGLDQVANRKATGADGNPRSWWLRTPRQGDDDQACYVRGDDGNVGFQVVDDENNYARPAFLLSSEDILFAHGADNSMQQDFGTIKEYDGNEWKVTLADGNSFANEGADDETELNKKDFTIGDTLQIHHRALKEISPDYNRVTMALVDEDDKICYYGSINKDVEATLSTVKLDKKLAAGDYVLYVYGEDWNGEKETDYATGKPYIEVITIKDSAPVITQRLLDGCIGVAYSGKLHAVGSGTLKWSIDSGSLPDGLTLNQDGTITGTPTREGVYIFTAKVENDLGSNLQPARIRICKAVMGANGETNGGGIGVDKLLTFFVNPEFTDFDIMYDLRKINDLNTADKVREALEAKLKEREERIGNTETHSVSFMYCEEEDYWEMANKEDFPKDGMLIQIPVPEGTSPEKNDYLAAYMCSANMDGRAAKAGDVVFPEDVREVQIDDRWYLEFYANDPAPIVSIGWMEEGAAAKDQTEPEELDSEPADDTTKTDKTDEDDTIKEYTFKGIGLDGEEYEYKTVIKSGLDADSITDALRKAGFDTPEKIEKKLYEVLKGIIKWAGKDNTEIYDVTLMVKIDGKWTEATKANFPKDGVPVGFDYPEGIDGKAYDATVIHMFAEDMKGGINAGDTETLEPMETDTEVLVTAHGLSPFLVHYDKTVAGPAVDSGDASDMTPWIIIMLLSAAAIATLTAVVFRRRTN